MRIVVDSNCLQLSKLEKHLANPKNEIILTDQVSLEAINSDMCKAFEIISRFPEQVFVLKRTSKILQLSLNSAGLQKRLIDKKASKNFRNLCKNIANKHRRDEVFRAQVHAMKQDANVELLKIHDAAKKISQLIIDYFSPLTKAEAKALRKGPPYKGETLTLILKRLEKMTIQLFAEKVNFNEPKFYKEFYNSYLFRSGACGYFLFQEWYIAGGLKDVKSKKMMNDLLDVQIAAYATYFDGLLSNDKKAMRIYKVSKYFITKTKNAK